MESDDEEITWKVIPNTVKSRMKDRSFLHKFTFSRRLRRTTKTINVKMKRHSKLKTYNEYVVMKTSVLRDVSDNTDTEDEDNLTDDDFTMVYKSETSLKKYAMERNRCRYSCLTDSESDDIDLNDQEIPKSEPQSKNSCVGWRKIKRRRTDLSTSMEKIENVSCAKVDRDNGKFGSDILDNDKLSLNKSKESVPTRESSISMKEKTDELPTKVMSSQLSLNKSKESVPTRENSISMKEKTDELPTKVMSSQLSLNKSKESVPTRENSISVKDKTDELPIKVMSSQLSLNKSKENVPTRENSISVKEKTDELPTKVMSSQLSLNKSKENVPTRENSISVKEKTDELPTKVMSSQLSLNKSKENVPTRENSISVKEKTDELPTKVMSSQLSLNKSKESVLTRENSISVKEETDELPTKVMSSNAFASDAVEELEASPQLENHGDSEANVDHYNCLGNDSSGKEKKNDEILEVQTLATCNKNQPKDSGIEEDVEEERLLQSKKHYKKCKSESQQKKYNITNRTDDMTCCDDLKSESSILPSTDSDDRILCDSKNKDVNKSELDTEETQKRKLQPRVVHTEIVNENYKIVLDKSLTTRSLEPEVSNAIISYDEQMHEAEDLECDMEDQISNSARKRLQQLKKLNLTMDTDSNSSENSETCSNADSMRSKLFNRTLDSSDSSASESGSINLKRKMTKNLKVKRNERLSQSGNFSQQSDDCWNNENSNLDRCSVLSFKKHKRKTSYLNPVSTCNSSQENVVKETEANLKNETAEQTVNEEPGLHRPQNLQEFVENENLQLQIAAPSFRFKDVKEDEIFIMDIPSAILETQLLGKRIVLTENKIKLGKLKYRVEYKDIGNLSCVVATGKSRKPYKAVNIKPMKRIVARERLR